MELKHFDTTLGFSSFSDPMNPVPRYATAYVSVAEREAVEIRFYKCPECQRLFAITAAARPTDPEQHDYYISRNLIGKSHFKHAARSWVMCWGRPVRVPDDPVLFSAYHLGGPDAIEAMNELPAQALASE